MPSLSHTTLSVTVRRLLADRRNASPTPFSTAPSASSPRRRAGAGRGRAPSTSTLRHELDSFRQAQGASYWHRDQRGG